MPDPAGAASALTPRPGRSLAWILFNAVRGTWFLVAIHLGALALLLTGATWLGLALFLPILLLRGFLTTAVLHRYFSHRSFKTSRAFQFVLGFLACSNMQRGPLWWAAIHRHHHRHSDEPADAHSPIQGGFAWSYFGWMFATLEQPDWNSVRDLTRYPELVWLERLWLVPGLLLAGLCWLAGGWSLVCLGFCLTAVIALHGASIVNSVGHLVGSRRYDTPDRSRNSWFLAFLTLGDGWHNNHHHYPHSAQAGFFPGEVDGCYAALRFLERLGLVWDLRRVPPHKLHPPPKEERRRLPGEPSLS
ncbi:MAG: acyl-CoA desaturase [Gemmataceae bacterium]|nr:acyl-CoA desaturase [Gemmataceae bacterium]